MRKKRTITIKNSRLQKVRNNLRIILINRAQDLWLQLNKEQKKIDRDANGNPRRIETLSQEEKEKFENIRAEVRQIDDIINHSICKCSLCSASDKDMTYNPVRERWYCVDCYQKLQQDFKGKEESALYP